MTNVIAGALLVAPCSSLFDGFRLLLVCLASFCLYSAGMALNDYADRERDLGRPEKRGRPFPSGQVAPGRGLAIVGVLFFLGWILAFSGGGWRSAAVATFLIGSVATYDLIAKRYGFLGAVAMGVCRGGNVVLGAQVLGSGPNEEGSFGFVSIGEIVIPPHGWILLGFVVLLTGVSLFEEERQHRGVFGILGLGMALVALFPFGLSILDSESFSLGWAFLSFVTLGFLAVRLAARVGSAFREMSSERVEAVVRAGVLGVPLLDAGALLAFGDWTGVPFILLLFFLARRVGRRLAVT